MPSWLRPASGANTSWQARLPAALADAVAWILLLDVLLSLLLALGFVPALFITRRAPMRRHRRLLPDRAVIMCGEG